MADYDFPDDLLELARDFNAADAARTQAANSGSDDEFQAAHARVQELAMRLAADEWLWSQPNRHEARQALRKAAQSAG